MRGDSASRRTSAGAPSTCQAPRTPGRAGQHPGVLGHGAGLRGDQQALAAGPATRTRPPGRTWNSPPCATANVRSTIECGATAAEPVYVGTVLARTGSCPTHRCGSASMRREQVGALRGRELPPEEARAAGAARDRLDDQPRQAGPDPGQRGGVAAPARRGRRQQQVLVQQPPRQRREVGQQAGVLEHARAQRVDDATPCPAGRPRADRARRAGSRAAAPAGRRSRCRRGAGPRRPGRGRRVRAARPAPP